MSTISPSLQIGGVNGWKGKEGAVLGWQQTSGGLFKPAKFDFSRLSGSASYVDENGLIQIEHRPNYPRFTWKDGKQCLMNEEARTNLQTYSEDFTNGTYTKVGLVISANDTTAPDGNSTADKVTINTATGEHVIFENTISLAAGTYATSIFLKQGSGTQFLQIGVNGATSTNWASIIFDIQNNTFSDPQSNGTYTLDNYKSVAFSDGWYRVDIVTTNSADIYRGIRVRFSNSATPSYLGFGSISFTGNGTDNFFAWGSQAEAASYASSYIPTSGSAVTRAAESIEGLNLGNFISSTEGAFLIKGTYFNTFGGNSRIVASDGTSDNRIVLYDPSNNLSLFSVSGGVNNGLVSSGSANVPNTFFAIAYAFDSTTEEVYLNGTQEATDTITASDFSALDRIELDGVSGGTPFRGLIEEIKFFQTKPSQSQLESDTQ